VAGRMARPNNLLAISTWTVEMSIILDPMASKKKDGGSPGKGMVVQLLHVFAADDSCPVLVDSDSDFAF